MRSESDTAHPLLRVMALHALAYCERLFYLEEVEGIYVADAAVYEGRRLHVEKEAALPENLTPFELESDALGLRGKFDALRKERGQWHVYEHKKGKSRRVQGKPAAWPSDEIQVLAYSLLLQEAVAEAVGEASIRYHADHATVQVPFDESSRDKVLDVVNRARALASSVQRPPISSNSNACLRCSLAPVCLPEEERWARDEEWEPIRLFPSDLERKTIHVLGHSSRISRKGESLDIITEEQTQNWPIQEIGELVIHGYAQITTQALHFCAQQEVGEPG